jgi:hypothetical protein
MQHSKDLSPSSSRSDNITSSRITFQVAALHLPPEILLHVLQEWLGQQRIIVGGSSHSNYTISYTNPENANPFAIMSRTSETPSRMLQEYFRSRIRSWLIDHKEFSDPTTFYMSHLLMSLKMADRLGFFFLPSHPWDTILRDPALSLLTKFPIVKDHDAQYVLTKHLSSLHGLEKIKLDFTAEQYFAMFDVAVPPFHYRDDTVTGDNLYRDDYCHGAGLFLAHTKELEIHFGDAYKHTHPWYDVQESAWCETNNEARLRPHICESGMVIDWILEYSWYGGHLQHIPKITLTGDVQQWVKDKWDDIFERHATYSRTHTGEHVSMFAVHRPDVIDLETIGMDDDDDDDDDDNDDDEAWMPQNHYPPPCKCSIGCWRLRGGVIEEELGVKSWDGHETYPDEVVGDWMNGVDLGSVV